MGDMLLGMAGGVGGQLLGRLFERHDDERQIKQQQALTDIQTSAAKELFNYTAAYNTPAAERKRLEEAGLNIGLMYGGQSTGASGQLGSPGGGQASGAAASESNRLQAMGMGLQLAQMKANIELTKAQAKEADANAELTAGGETEKKAAEVKALNQSVLESIQRTANEGLKSAGIEWQNRIIKIEADVAEATKENKIGMSLAALNNLELANDELNERIYNLKLNNYEYQESMEWRIESYRANLANIFSSIALNQAQGAAAAAAARLSEREATAIGERLANDKLRIDNETNHIKNEEVANQIRREEMENVLKRERISASKSIAWTLYGDREGSTKGFAGESNRGVKYSW